MLEGKRTFLASLATILGAVAAALGGVTTWGEAISLIVPAVLASTLRMGMKSEANKAKVLERLGPPMAVLVLMVLSVGTMTGCAAPAATQGSGTQGGSATAPLCVVSVNIGTGGGVESSVSSVPTAAPASTSNAQADQKADASPKTDVTVPASVLGGAVHP